MTSALQASVPDQPRLCVGDTPEVLTSLYNNGTNLSIWQRQLPEPVEQYSAFLLSHYPHNTEVRLSASAHAMAQALAERLPEHPHRQAFIDDVSLIADMLTCLLDAEAIGLRLCTADKATCPRFHVDKLGCRLITTYQGKATQWIDNASLNRTKLGRGAQGKPDDSTGLFPSAEVIETMHSGDIAILKGELWPGNQGNGIVHRSPPLQGDERRLFLTMDAMT
ncbi:DUF1826 domain-containing protein [Gilvimarinus sp. 1_MG-2023]|uniref:DUF1826 domain-containing protein n=1 Tax=Gilvimarinus sp. 1_MG-2023 TaxID=3062638 RepID=UPI0026E30FF1|nr:DUF1826 domain-containing protein [Gilvimarinus sp. 1_MG-2023]MDO6748173.1 DUF1826 domain-containing protein [Gilvimarinus sp. 1_MG-2023]